MEKYILSPLKNQKGVITYDKFKDHTTKIFI